MAQFVWVEKVGRYRDAATGQWVADAAVKAGVENVAAQAAVNMRALAMQYRTTNMEIADFQRAMMQEIKLAHIASALAAVGGRAAMTPSHWGRVGQLIREQYQYVQGMVTQTLDGVQRVNGRLDARAASYGSAVRATFENMRRFERAAAGYQYEKNILHANESCGQCRDLAAMGFVPMGTLTPVGMRQCRSNCRCTITYRERFEAEAPVELPALRAS